MPKSTPTCSRHEARVLSLDPGDHLGWTTFDPETESVRCGMLLFPPGGWELPALRSLDEMIEWADVVIVENFKVESRLLKDTGSIINAAELLGHIQGRCLYLGKRMIRSPNSNKSVWTDKKLKKLKLYEITQVGEGEHARDSLRHLLQWMRDVRHPYLITKLERVLSANVRRYRKKRAGKRLYGRKWG